jgi:hypothetical protein
MVAKPEDRLTAPTEPLALAPAAPGVDAWFFGLERTHAEIEQFTGWLSAAERTRPRFGTDALRERWIAGRAPFG